MGKLSKLFKGELKKIFLGLGIFFMSALLILALTISPKLFNPTEVNNLKTTYMISTSSVEDVYQSFKDYDSELKEKINELESQYTNLINENNDFSNNLLELSKKIYNLRIDFNKHVVNLISSIDETEQSQLNIKLSNCLTNLIEKTKEYQSLYQSYSTGNIVPLILVNEGLNYNITFEYEKLLNILNSKEGQGTSDFYRNINDSLMNYGCTTNLLNYSKEIKNLKYDNNNLQNVIDTYKNKKNEYKQSILEQIEIQYYEAVSDDEYNISKSNILNTKQLSYDYLGSNENYYKILYYSLFLEFSSSSSDTDISMYIGFEDFNSYKIQEQLTKNIFLFENEKTNLDYSNVFSFNALSSENSKTFDYMFFTLELSSFLIIAFTVIVGAGMVSKENTEGTLKLLSIRPFNRNKILFAKILATIFLSTLFVFIVIIVSLITGFILYGGISLSETLIIFNSNTALALPIWVVFLIYVACLIIKIWIYALLSITISTIFKSYIGAVCISAGIYILNLIITFVSNGANWLKYNIFSNLDLFKYFGGSFINRYESGRNLNNLFVSPVFSDTSIILPIIIILSTAFILNLILFSVFKNKDVV